MWTGNRVKYENPKASSRIPCPGTRSVTDKKCDQNKKCDQKCDQASPYTVSFISHTVLLLSTEKLKGWRREGTTSCRGANCVGQLCKMSGG